MTTALSRQPAFTAIVEFSVSVGSTTFCNLVPCNNSMGWVRGLSAIVPLFKVAMILNARLGYVPETAQLEKDTAEKILFYQRCTEHLNEASVHCYVCWVTRSISDFPWWDRMYIAFWNMEYMEYCSPLPTQPINPLSLKENEGDMKLKEMNITAGMCSPMKCNGLWV